MAVIVGFNEAPTEGSSCIKRRRLSAWMLLLLTLFNLPPFELLQVTLATTLVVMLARCASSSLKADRKACWQLTDTSTVCPGPVTNTADVCTAVVTSTGTRRVLPRWVTFCPGATSDARASGGRSYGRSTSWDTSSCPWGVVGSTKCWGMSKVGREMAGNGGCGGLGGRGGGLAGRG